MTSLRVIKKLVYFKDIRLDRASYILSHGTPYFKYLGIYTEKTLLYFTPMDDIVYSMYSPDNLSERKNKILLSGSIARYPLRRLLHNHIITKNIIATTYYEHLNHDFHENKIADCKSGCLYSYFAQIAKYKGAFVGYCEKPIDHILYKTFEILATGTILFSEEKPQLAEIGLQKYVHYVPIDAKNMLDIAYLDKYLNTDAGKTIAVNDMHLSENISITKKI